MPITNTLETARRIESLGFSHQQAQGFAELFEGTAQDAVRDMKAAVAQEGDRTRVELRGEIKSLELRLTVRFGVMLAAAVGLVAALQQFFR